MINMIASSLIKKRKTTRRKQVGGPCINCCGEMMFLYFSPHYLISKEYNKKNCDGRFDNLSEILV
jgi:hypothetical protein